MSFSLGCYCPGDSPREEKPLPPTLQWSQPSWEGLEGFLPTVGLFEHAKGGGRGPAPEGGWHFWSNSAIKRKPLEHGMQALPVDPAGGRPVTGGSEGLEHSEDPGRTWWPAPSPDQVWDQQGVVSWGLAHPPRSPGLSSARGCRVSSGHVQQRGSEAPAAGHLAHPAGRLLFIGLQ